MIRLIKESFNSDGGYIDAFNVNIGKITREVNDAIQEAVSYIDSGNAYPTWYWELGHDDEKMWCLVLGFADGYEPNDNEFTDSYGQALALKWGAISNRSAMHEFDMDFEMPYDEETGDVWDSCNTINSFDASRDVKYEIEDFYAFVKQYNASFDDEFDESFSKRRSSKHKSVRESRKPVSKRIVKESKRDDLEGYVKVLNNVCNIDENSPKILRVEGAYGMVRLVYETQNTGECIAITGYMSTQALFGAVLGMVNLIQELGL